MSTSSCWTAAYKWNSAPTSEVSTSSDETARYPGEHCCHVSRMLPCFSSYRYIGDFIYRLQNKPVLPMWNTPLVSVRLALTSDHKIIQLCRWMRNLRINRDRHKLVIIKRVLPIDAAEPCSKFAHNVLCEK